MIEAAEAMIKCLEAEGIKTVFGYPGAAICPFYDHLYNSRIRHILVRHEANAGHSASGYARITGRPAVCAVTSGPGAANIITAIATAYADSIPMIIITGQVSSDQIGRDVFQEADITGAVQPFIKHSYLVKDAQKLPNIFKEAFYIAGTGRQGPVLIDVPVDIQKTKINFEYPKTVSMRAYKPLKEGKSSDIAKIMKAVNNSEKPLICAGGGVFSSNAQKEIQKFAERTDIPVVTTMMGIGTYPANNNRNFGMIGTHGNQLANSAVAECDLLILAGARVGDRAVTQPEFLAKNTKIIHIDIDPAEIGKNINTDIYAVGDLKTIFIQLLGTVTVKKHTKWLNELNSRRTPKIFEKSKKGFINPKEFISKLSEMSPDNTIITADVGQNQIWAANNFKVVNGRFLTSGGMGTMGYSLPAAIGAKLAAPKNPVIAICGDGSFQMQFMELATIKQHNIPVKIIVMKNGKLGMVRELQNKAYGDREIAVDLSGSPDFIQLAQAYDIPSMRINNVSMTNLAFEKIFNEDGPFLLECVVSAEEPSL